MAQAQSQGFWLAGLVRRVQETSRIVITAAYYQAAAAAYLEVAKRLPAGTQLPPLGELLADPTRMKELKQMVLFRQCPRCGGDVRSTMDLDGPSFTCVQCGHSMAVEALAKGPQPQPTRAAAG